MRINILNVMFLLRGEDYFNKFFEWVFTYDCVWRLEVWKVVVVKKVFQFIFFCF